VIRNDISAATYLDHIRADGERITEAAGRHLDDPVPTCPGNTVGSLLLHIGGACRFWTDLIRENGYPAQPDWSTFPSEPIEFYVKMREEFIGEISGRDPEQPTWTWGTNGRVRFWYRRAAQELSVHRWDVENAVGTAQPIDAELAIDGIDEIAQEFGPKSDHPSFRGVSERFEGDGQTLAFEATDIDAARTFTMLPERVDVTNQTDGADVTARGTASDLLLFLWGRVPPTALDVRGDESLLDRWQERVKI